MLGFERTANGWRATKLTRAGYFTVSAMSVRAALMAAAARAETTLAH
jgi:hypothetical protein